MTKEVKKDTIHADNVYQLLLAFDHLYHTFCEADQKDFMRAFIERIDIYPEKPDNDCWISNLSGNQGLCAEHTGLEVSSLYIAQVKQK